MSDSTHRLAIFPGTFDPPSNGHLDVIRRGARLFDELIVAVGDNPDKTAMFSRAERVELVREVVAGMANVRAEGFDGLTVDFARRVGAAAILRGIRNTSDLQAEFQLALTNRAVAGVETVFVIPAAEYAFTSSSLIRQIAGMGGDVSALAPPEVLARLGKLRRPGPGADCDPDRA